MTPFEDHTVGKIVKVYRVTCADCYHDEYIEPSWLEEAGKLVLYKATAKMAFRVLYGWRIIKGDWHCPDCLRRMEEEHDPKV